MKHRGWLVVLLGSLVIPKLAQAEGAPPARAGFQAAFRTGHSIPVGTFAEQLPLTGFLPTQNPKLSDSVAGQLPLFLELGVKVVPELFVGGYAAWSYSTVLLAGGRTCDENDVSCVSLHLGVEAQYHFLPAGLADPWLGYGIGYESFSVSGPYQSGETLSGIELSRISIGVDFRVERTLGAGPFVDLSVGQFSSQHVDPKRDYCYDCGPEYSQSAGIAQKAPHGWLTIGIRIVAFP